MMNAGTAGRAALVILCWLLAAALAAGLAGQKSGEKTLSYEVHLLLDADRLLDEDHQLKEEYRGAFGTEEEGKLFSVTYLETRDRAFSREGWINRLRRRLDQPEKKIRLTYKKRYLVPGDDIGAALLQAEADGLDWSGGLWSAEIEWSYSGMTLSVSQEVKIDPEEDQGPQDAPPAGSGLPEEAVLKEFMPREELDWGAGLPGGSPLQLLGPVRFARFAGTFLGQETDLEIWEIQDRASGETRYITELSFAAEDLEEAAAARERMIGGLAGMGLLVRQDALKTQLILEAYSDR